MRKNWLFKYALAVCLIAVLTGGVAVAQSGYVLGRGLVAGGGYIASTSSGGGYSLGGSIGQAVVGSMSGGTGTTYTVGGGFWGGGATTTSTSNYEIYLPITIKN